MISCKHAEANDEFLVGIEGRIKGISGEVAGWGEILQGYFGTLTLRAWERRLLGDFQGWSIMVYLQLSSTHSTLVPIT